MSERYAESMKKITQESVFQALMLLLKEKPFDRLTITEITQKAGVSRPAFYRSYQTKEDILVLYCREEFQKLLVRVRNCEEHTKYGRIREFFRYFDEEHEFMEVIIQCQLTHVIYDTFCESMTEFFRDQTNQLEVSRAHGRYLPQYISSGVFRILIEWIRNGREESVDEMVDFMFEVTGR